MGYQRLDLASAPPPTREPADYDGASALSVVCTQTGLTSREQARLVDRWCQALPTLSAVKRLYFFSRVPQRIFDAACEIRGLEVLSIKWSGIKSLDRVESLSTLRALRIGASAQVESIEPLSGLGMLESLELEALTRIRDLSPLSRLTGLRWLELEGGMSAIWWVDTLSPLATLVSLEHLKLATLKVRDKSLAAVANLHDLRELRLPNYFPPDQYALLAAHLTGVNPPITAIFARTTNNLKCRRCGGCVMVLPVGAGEKWLCETCDAALIAEKAGRFNELVRRHA